MAITAEEINNVSFSMEKRGGYDVDEVDVFLEHVAEEVDAMNSQIAAMDQEIIRLQFELKGGTLDTADDAVVPDEADAAAAAEQAGLIEDLQKQVADLKSQLAEKNANDNAISQALIVAQRSADEIVGNARVEASNIIKDADEEADRIVGKAESDRLKIAESIRLLENDRTDVRAEYRDMLSNFMADAQRKLAEIDGDARRAAVSAQARADANAASYVGAAAPAASDYAAAPAAVPAQVPTGYVEKDFSGYGDAADDFAFDVD